MTNEELAYFAGFFDGEGCIGMTNRVSPHPALFIRTMVVNTDLELLEQMKQAELAIEFQEDRSYKGQRRSPEQLQRGQEIRNLISSFNGRKGVKNFVAA